MRPRKTSNGKKQGPKAKKGEASPRIYSVVEVDPALEDPKLLEAIREKNKDALAHALDPNRGPLKTNKANTAETAWYFTSGPHHVTGNLDLLTDLTPVIDRWTQCTLGVGPPWQVLARGSVNINGIILHDVWFVPDCGVNLVSGCQLGLMWVDSDGTFSIIRHDAVVGKGHHMGAAGLLELDFINLKSGAVWYIASNVSQHMTGNLHLLTDFNPT
ncbi:hypothetical protein SETIT_3G289500v2 [Setaria italica]|uniref:Retrovirus-related Pol polyprotein from transposon TNT 1-94-like beta-barrel domain-containing protein n=1 Tax=Setaria italica TaxID=4555 RepID=A0A368QK31_SETIT|nr:hypothetical protein SETIT_3G289500v2 [Setaria italica]